MKIQIFLDAIIKCILFIILCGISHQIMAAGVPSKSLIHTIYSKRADSAKTVTPDGTVQIGNSFFETLHTAVTPIRQVGISYEDRAALSDIFLYYNQLLSNNLFYEIRAYTAYNYQSSNPMFLTPRVSDKMNPLGYGFVGIIGYVMPLNSNVSLMPFLRLSYYKDFFVVYKGSNGDSIHSNQYIAQGGARLSLKVNNVFAIYASYWGGYHVIYLNGSGRFAESKNPKIDGLASTLELGAPYKMTQHFSVAPYIDFNVNANNPNESAKTFPYRALAITTSNIFFAIKLSYDF